MRAHPQDAITQSNPENSNFSINVPPAVLIFVPRNGKHGRLKNYLLTIIRNGIYNAFFLFFVCVLKLLFIKIHRNKRTYSPLLG